MNPVFKKSLLILCVAVGFSLVACDDDGSSSGGNDTMSGSDATSGGDTSSGGDTTQPDNSGQTPCGMEPFVTTCQAGQYCANQNVSVCENGCLSNQNCANDQTCIIPTGESVGACQNNSDPIPTGATRDEVCNRLEACDPTNYTDEFCDQFYAGTNAECHDCLAGANCGNIFDVCATPCGFDFD